MSKSFTWAVVVLAAIAALGLSGCAEQNPVAPASALSTDGDLSTAELTLFCARVMTTDQNRRMVTFVGQPDTVVAAHNCEIVRFNNDTEAPIPFTEIQPGDSMGVSGNREQNGYVLATRLRVHIGTCYDVSLRDTIAEIDYGMGWFRVASRMESILIDSNTLIWGTLASRRTTAERTGFPEHFTVSSHGPGQITFRRDTALAFTDLKVGDVIELRANIVDESTLLAGMIKLVDCRELGARCLQFGATLSTVNAELRQVTFEGLSWLGIVCDGARLLDASGLSIALTDFLAGEVVEIKGFPTVGDTLSICQMQKT